jgi:gamma-glutamyltranspeptidase / glutathione hydrolase
MLPAHPSAWLIGIFSAAIKKLTLACLLVAIHRGNPNIEAQDRVTGRTFATRSEVIAQHGMAATSQPLATQIALDILKQGGSAVDAAIAANAALGLMEPTGNGIGGDLFAIVWIQADQKLYGLNASGRSPASLSLETLKQQLGARTTIPQVGPLPVTVPGCVDGWYELHGKFGKLPMREILAPAIRYARDGFPVSELIAFYWERSRGLAAFPGFQETFLPHGRAPQAGEIFKNPDLANTLERISIEGRDTFYRGEIAHSIADFMQRHEGYLSYDDLANHHSEWVEPVSVDYRGYTVWELPPNGQGIAALQMLNILSGYDLRAMGFGSADYIHHFVEAKKLAFEDRAKFYADPAFHRVPVQELISSTYADSRRKLIQHRAALRYPAGDAKLEQGDTIYLTVADSERNMVSLIQSNYRGMGSGMCPDRLGFCLQDRGELFHLDPQHANVYAPGKRPFHTIIPAFVTRDGKPYLSFGVMGGATQPQGHVQILVNMIDFGMNVQEAGDAPRILHNGSSEPTGEVMTDGGQVCLETGIPYEVIRELMDRGHAVGFNRGEFGGFQGIHYDATKDVFRGASESRKDGQAAGY